MSDEGRELGVGIVIRSEAAQAGAAEVVRSLEDIRAAAQATATGVRESTRATALAFDEEAKAATRRQQTYSDARRAEAASRREEETLRRREMRERSQAAQQRLREIDALIAANDRRFAEEERQAAARRQMEQEEADATQENASLFERAAATIMDNIGAISLIAKAAGLTAFARHTAELNARFVELGMGMEIAARNAGKTLSEAENLEGALRRTGISAIQARQAILQTSQANIEYADAVKLARVAQDAAVVGQLNSSDAYQRMLYAIQSGSIVILRNLGLNVQFGKAYEEMAKSLGKSTDALTEEERVKARVNAVTEKGAALSGLYERSMDSASKQLRSATRYSEDLRVSIGASFQPAYTAAVMAYVNGLKLLADNAKLVAGVISGVLVTAITASVPVLLTALEALRLKFIATGGAAAAAAALASPWVLALAALGAAVGYVVARQTELEKVNERVGDRMDKERQLVERASDSYYKLAAAKAAAATGGTTGPSGMSRSEAEEVYAVRRREEVRVGNKALGGAGDRTAGALQRAVRDFRQSDDPVAYLKSLREIEVAATGADRSLVAAFANAAQATIAAGIASGRYSAALFENIKATEELEEANDALKESQQSAFTRLSESQTVLAIAMQGGKKAVEGASAGLSFYRELTNNSKASMLDYTAALNGSSKEAQAVAQQAKAMGASLLSATESTRKFTDDSTKAAEAWKQFSRAMSDRVFNLDPAATGAAKTRREIERMREEAEKFGEKGKAAVDRFVEALRASELREREAQEQKVTAAMQAQVAAAQNVLLGEQRLAAARAVSREAGEKAQMQMEAYAQAAKLGLPPVQTLAQAATLYALALERQKVAQADAARESLKGLEKQVTDAEAYAEAVGKGALAVRELAVAEAVRAAVLKDPALAGQEEVVEALVRRLMAAQQAAARFADRARLAQETWLEAGRGIQRTFTSVIEDAFRGSLRSARDYADVLTDIFRTAAANIAAAFVSERLGVAKLMEALANGESSGSIGSFIGDGGLMKGRGVMARGFGGAVAGAAVGTATGSAAMGLLGGAVSGAMVGGPAGAIVGAITGLATGLFEQSKRAKESAREFESAMREYGRTMNQFREDFVAPISQFDRELRDLGRFAADRLKDLSATFGVGLTGDFDTMTAERLRRQAGLVEASMEYRGVQDRPRLAAFASEIRKLADEIEAGEKRMAEMRQQANVRAREDLEVRALAAQGMDEEASARRVALQQQREMEEAVKAGYDEVTLKALEYVQALELEAIARERAKVEARKQQEMELSRADTRARGLAADGDLAGAARASVDAEFMRQMADATNRLADKLLTQEDFDELARIIGKERDAANEAIAQGYADRMDDLGLRGAAARRDPAVADMAFDLAQQREMREALRDTSEEGKAFAAALREVQEAEKAAREEQKAKAQAMLMEDLEVRALVAAGEDGKAASMRRELERQRELEAATDETVRARLQEIYAIEDATRTLNEAFEKEMGRRSLDAREAAARGDNVLAESIRLEVERRRELNEAADEETRARLRTIHALEDEAAARGRARANEETYSAIQAEVLRLKGDEIGAMKVEFAFRQAAFKEELEQKLANNLITQKTYTLGLELLKLRDSAFQEKIEELMREESAIPTLDGPLAADAAARSSSSAQVTSRLIAGPEVSQPLNALVGYAAQQIAVLRSIDQRLAAMGGASAWSPPNATNVDQQLGESASITARSLGVEYAV